MKHDESRIQTAIMQFLDAALPASYRAFAIPNGGNRSAVTGAILKREGVKPGIPDIAVVRGGGAIAFLEVKTAKGRLSPSQAEFKDWCGENAVPYAVVRGLGDVQTFLMDMGVPMKGRAAA